VNNAEQTSKRAAAIPAASAGEQSTSALAMEPGRQARRYRTLSRFLRHKPAVAGLTFVIALLILAIFAAQIAPNDPNKIHITASKDGPSSQYWLGNDDVGRDILSRLIFGSRIALIVGVGATAIAVTIGVSIGAVAGYFGGWVDSLLSRIVDSLMAFPLLALLLTLSAVFGPSLRNVVIVIGCSVWASYARIVRAEVLSLRERDYVLAARSYGATSRRIIFRHIVPNAMGPVIIIASLAVGSIIILESALSFLGLGVQRPTASWGTMLSDGRDYIRNYPHISIAPGIAITLTVLAFNLIGDGLRDALDPRQRD
jgi:ABC-type dipeptide/oligopeptide/nickel transport system permease subunit